MRTRAVVVLFALLLGACNGDEPQGSAADGTGSESPSPAGPNEYMATLCTEMTTWLTEIQRLQAEVGTSVQPGADPTQAQAALTTFFDNALAATDDLLQALDGVGAPAIDRGQSIHEKVTSKFEEVRETFEEGRGEVDTLPVDDREAFISEAAKLRESVESQLKAIGDALATLSHPDLDAAAAEVSECSGLKPTGG